MFSHNRFLNKFILSYLVFAVIAFSILMFSYQNTLSCYGFSDDYTVFNQVLNDSFLTGFLALGRPLHGVFTRATFGLCDSICELRYVRMISIIGIALFGLLLFRAFRLSGWGKLESGCFAIATCLMPAYEVYAAWAIEFIHPYAMGLSFIACELCLRSYGLQGFKNVWHKKATMIFVCIVFLLASLSMYQPAVQAFWLFVAIALFRPDENDADLLRKFTFCLTIFSVSVIVYLILYKANIWPFTVEPIGRSRLTTDPLSKFLWFFEEPLFDTLSLTMVLAKKNTIIFTATVTLSFIFFGLYRRIKRIPYGKYRFLSLFLCLPALAYQSNLASAESFSAFRTQAALSGLILFYILLAFKEVFQGVLKNFVLLGGVAACVAMAYQNVTNGFVIPQKQELSLLRHSTAAALTSRLDKIALIRPSLKDSIAERLRYDEFGLPSTYQPWVPIPLIKIILKEMNVKNENRVKIECYEHNSTSIPKKGTSIINMGQVLREFNKGILFK